MNTLTKVQEHYLALNKNEEYFEVKGHSLICRKTVFPVAMARHLGVRPTRCNHFILNKVWN